MRALLYDITTTSMHGSVLGPLSSFSVLIVGRVTSPPKMQKAKHALFLTFRLFFSTPRCPHSHILSSIHPSSSAHAHKHNHVSWPNSQSCPSLAPSSKSPLGNGSFLFCCLSVSTSLSVLLRSGSLSMLNNTQYSCSPCALPFLFFSYVDLQPVGMGAFGLVW